MGQERCRELYIIQMLQFKPRRGLDVTIWSHSVPELLLEMLQVLVDGKVSDVVKG